MSLQRSGSRALTQSQRWEALGEERQTALIQMGADLKNSGVVREKLRVGIFGRRYRQVFKGSEAVDWLVQSETAGSREEAVRHCDLLVAGNLLRSAIDDSIDFKDSIRAVYKFVADDQPCDGPSVASIISSAVLEGWLDVALTGHVPVFLRRSKKARYCMVKQHGRSSILYYFTCDTAAKPEGFINLDSKKTFVTIRHFDHRDRKDAFRLTATAGNAKLDMVGIAASHLQVERWIRTFVIAGATYAERFRRGITGARSIYDFTAYDIYRKPVAFDRFRGRVVLVVNVASRSKLAARHFTQLQRLHEDYWDGGKGLVIVAFPCNQFENEEPTDGVSIVDAVSQYGVQFYIMDKVNVNGCGTSLNVPPIWEFLKSKKEGVNGPYIPWNFTKFLIDRRGNPVQRYDPSIQPNNLRDAIDALLAAPCPAASTVSQLMQPVQHDHQRNQHSRRASDHLVSALLPHTPAAATAPSHAPQAEVHGGMGGTPAAWAEHALSASIPSDRMGGVLSHGSTDVGVATRMPDLGPYYTFEGAGPFPPSPVMQPSRARAGRADQSTGGGPRPARVSPLKLRELSRVQRFVRDRPQFGPDHHEGNIVHRNGAGPNTSSAIGPASLSPASVFSAKLPPWQFREEEESIPPHGVASQISALTAPSTQSTIPREPALVLQPPPPGHRRRDDPGSAAVGTVTSQALSTVTSQGVADWNRPQINAARVLPLNDMHYDGFDDVFVFEDSGGRQSEGLTVTEMRHSGDTVDAPDGIWLGTRASGARLVSQAGGDNCFSDTISAFSNGDAVHLPPCGSSLPALLNLVPSQQQRRGFLGDAVPVMLDNDRRWFEDFDGVFHIKDDDALLDSGTGGSTDDGHGTPPTASPEEPHPCMHVSGFNASAEEGCGRPMSISAACTPTLFMGVSTNDPDRGMERKDSACLSMSPPSPAECTPRFTFNLPLGAIESPRARSPVCADGAARDATGAEAAGHVHPAVGRPPPKVFSPVRGPIVAGEQEPLSPVVSNLRTIGLIRRWALQNPDIHSTTV